MLKIMFCAALAITVATAASAAPKGGSAGGVYRFVGYATTTLRTGDEGFVAMHTSCQEDFGPLARMCTTEELFLSPNAASPDEGEAWVHSIGNASGGQADFIGGPSVGTCKGWSDASAGGVVIGAGGVIMTLPCGNTRQVTCCAPAK